MMRIMCLAILALAACKPVAPPTARSAAPTEGWVYRAPAASDDTGGVYVTNPSGITMQISCGNSGIAGIELSPDPRPAALRGIGNAVLWLSVDGGRGKQLPATCTQYGCSQDAMLGGEPFPTKETARIIRQLRAGNSVEVQLSGQVIQTFTLSGSSRAIGAFQQAQGRNCEGL